MKTLIEYQLEDGITVFIEGESEDGGIAKVSRDRSGNVIMMANQNFKSAMASVTSSASTLLREIEDMGVVEAEITVGLTTAGETGTFIIGKGTENANFAITLKWRRGGTK
jgi:hypothetical protein